MTENTKPLRTFCVIGSGTTLETSPQAFSIAKTPRAAAVEVLNTAEFAESTKVEVFEIGRGRRYARQSTAVPVGKAQ